MPASSCLDGDIDATLQLSEQLRIQHFLNGQTDGHALLEALYGAAAHEPVPERLVELLRNAQQGR
jgi:hypothetical protein